MPLEEEVGVGRRRTTNRNAANGTQAVLPSVQGRLKDDPHSGLFGVGPDILSYYTGRSDGYLRIMRSRQDGSVFLRWKWTSGPHKDYYVMWVCEQGTVSSGLVGLSTKIDEVESGLRTAVLDRYTR